jgi:hypothetical protein
MTELNEKLTEQFTGLKIKFPEVAKNLNHIYSDYVELVALFNGQDFITKSEVMEKIKGDGETKINDVIKIEAEDEEISGDLFDDSNTSKRSDLKERWIDNLFKVIEDRSQIFNKDYPFNYSEETGLILKNKISEKQELYIFLLIASNLDLFNKVASDLTTDFEEVSYYILKGFLSSAVVKRFGKKSDYAGNARTKIRALAKDMKLDVDESSLENISIHNNQERGLDIIGWFPFSDDCSNIIAILGQCACGKDWPRKYHDLDRFSNYMKYFRQRPIHAMFIPYALISRNNNWFYCSDDIRRDSMIFERKRIIDLFSNKKEFDSMPSKIIVEACYGYTEDLV